MVSIHRLRIEREWTLEYTCKLLAISIATLSRIESKERDGEKLPLDEKVAHRFARKVNEVFGLECELEDLPVVVSQVKRGRPKKVQVQA